MSYFKNPGNGHVEQVTNNASWLWFVLFGPLYFLYKGAWRAVLISLIGLPCLVTLGFYLGVMIGLTTYPGSGLAVAFGILIPLLVLLMCSTLVKPEIERVFRMKGWTEVDSEGNEISDENREKISFWSLDSIRYRD